MTLDKYRKNAPRDHALIVKNECIGMEFKPSETGLRRFSLTLKSEHLTEESIYNGYGLTPTDALQDAFNLAEFDLLKQLSQLKHKLNLLGLSTQKSQQ